LDQGGPFPVLNRRLNLAVDWCIFNPFMRHGVFVILVVATVEASKQSEGRPTVKTLVPE
jgi:hypothetical protein